MADYCHRISFSVGGSDRMHVVSVCEFEDCEDMATVATITAQKLILDPMVIFIRH